MTSSQSWREPKFWSSAAASIGPEVDDKQLLDFPLQVLDVVLTNRCLIGQTLGRISEIGTVAKPISRRLFAQAHTRRRRDP